MCEAWGVGHPAGRAEPFQLGKHRGLSAPRGPVLSGWLFKARVTLFSLVPLSSGPDGSPCQSGHHPCLALPGKAKEGRILSFFCFPLHLSGMSFPVAFFLSLEPLLGPGR